MDDLKAVRKNTDMIPQISEDIKAVRKTTDATLDEIKGISEAKAAFLSGDNGIFAQGHGLTPRREAAKSR